MCLIDKKRFRFTIFPKKVYKIVKVVDDTMYSPYRNTIISKIMCGDKRIKPEKDKYNKFIFSNGFIYAYVNKRGANVVCCMHNFFNLNSYYIVLEGYIPLFTRYAKSYTSSEICARKMIFNI